MLRCDACGAFRPVTKRSTSSQQQQQQDAVEEDRPTRSKSPGRAAGGDGVAEKGLHDLRPRCRRGRCRGDLHQELRQPRASPDSTDTVCCNDLPVRPRYGLRSHRN